MQLFFDEAFVDDIGIYVFLTLAICSSEPSCPGYEASSCKSKIIPQSKYTGPNEGKEWAKGEKFFSRKKKHKELT